MVNNRKLLIWVLVGLVVILIFYLLVELGAIKFKANTFIKVLIVLGILCLIGIIIYLIKKYNIFGLGNVGDLDISKVKEAIIIYLKNNEELPARLNNDKVWVSPEIEWGCERLYKKGDLANFWVAEAMILNGKRRGHTVVFDVQINQPKEKVEKGAFNRSWDDTFATYKFDMRGLPKHRDTDKDIRKWEYLSSKFQPEEVREIIRSGSGAKGYEEGMKPYTLSREGGEENE